MRRSRHFDFEDADTAETVLLITVHKQFIIKTVEMLKVFLREKPERPFNTHIANLKKMLDISEMMPLRLIMETGRDDPPCMYWYSYEQMCLAAAVDRSVFSLRFSFYHHFYSFSLSRCAASIVLARNRAAAIAGLPSHPYSNIFFVII